MNKLRPIRQPEPAWQVTTPGDLAPLAAPAAAVIGTAGPRPQPPLREVLHGLDARELEGPTVFDQLFGPASLADVRPRRW